MRQLSYLYALFKANWKGYSTDGWRTATLSFVMLLQNLMFFMLWVVFFGAVGKVKGWQLQDVALMYGLLASAIGTSLFLFGGVRTIAMRAYDGSIDAYLTRPRHPLMPILMSKTDAPSLGDALSGPILWFSFGNLALADFPRMLMLDILAAIIFTAAATMIYSLAFWVHRGGRFSDQMFEIIIIFSSIPQHVQPLGIKVLMFSVLPAGFICMIPVSLMHDFDVATFMGLVAAALIYVALAIAVFSAGIRRYVSSSE